MYFVHFTYSKYSVVCGGGADLHRRERNSKTNRGSTVTFLSLPRGITRGGINYSKLVKKRRQISVLWIPCSDAHLRIYIYTQIHTQSACIYLSLAQMTGHFRFFF